MDVQEQAGSAVGSGEARGRAGGKDSLVGTERPVHHDGFTYVAIRNMQEKSRRDWSWLAQQQRNIMLLHVTHTERCHSSMLKLATRRCRVPVVTGRPACFTVPLKTTPVPTCSGLQTGQCSTVYIDAHVSRGKLHGNDSAASSGG